MYTSHMYALQKKIYPVFPASVFLKTLHPALSVEIASWRRLRHHNIVVSLNHNLVLDLKPQNCSF